MAYAVEVTLGTGNKVSLNYQSEEVNVSITYKLERLDRDVLEVVNQKAPELVEAHRLAWEQVREAKAPRPPVPVMESQQETTLQELPLEETTAAPSDDEVVPEEERLEEQEAGYGASSTNEDLQVPVTAAQIQVILALSDSLSLDEQGLKQHLVSRIGQASVECLKQAQAAALIVELSRERRGQLNLERNNSG